MSSLSEMMVLIATGAHHDIENRPTETTSLTTARLARRDEFFLAERLAQIYEGNTALHAVSFSYDAEVARDLIARGAEIRASNRRRRRGTRHASGRSWCI